MFHNNYSYDLFLHLLISVGCQKESVNYSFELIFDFVLFSGWGPYAYFVAMEESRNNASVNRESPVVQTMDDSRLANQVPRRNGDAFTPFTYLSPTLEAMEMGHNTQAKLS
jgi:hypothetical protein